MKTYLVTGGCGFIGSHLVDVLHKGGHFVRVLDDLSTGKRSNLPASVELMIGDVSDPRIVEAAMHGADGCFHLAAIASVQRSTDDWLGAHRANLTGAITIFDAARHGAAGPIPVVYASSAAVYGDVSAMPLSEDLTVRPLTAYGADKLGCELHGRVATQVHHVPTTGFRFFNVYGPRQDPKSPYSGVISIFSHLINGGHTVTINGDGDQVRDFVYVEDVVRYLVAAMSEMPLEARVFNVCTGRSTTINALARLIGAASGKIPTINYGPARLGDIRSSIGCTKKLISSFGFTAQVRLDDGLKRTLDWNVSGI